MPSQSIHFTHLIYTVLIALFIGIIIGRIPESRYTYLSLSEPFKVMEGTQLSGSVPVFRINNSKEDYDNIPKIEMLWVYDSPQGETTSEELNIISEITGIDLPPFPVSTVRKYYFEWVEMHKTQTQEDLLLSDIMNWRIENQ